MKYKTIVNEIEVELTEEQLDELIKQRGVKKGERFFFPEDGEIYNYLISDGVGYTKSSYMFDDEVIARGVYRTREIAQKEDEKRKALVRMWKFVQENGLYFEPNFKDESKKYFPLYDYNSKEWSTPYCNQHRLNFLFPHFKSEEDCQKFIDNNLSDLNLFV